MALLLTPLLLAGATAANLPLQTGYGQVFPAPDPADPVDVPPPFAAPSSTGPMTRGSPAAVEPRPTFAPVNESHVYVAARDSTVAPPNATLFVCDGAGDEREINDAIAAGQGGVVELLDGHFRCSDRITLLANTTLRGQGSGNTTVEITARPRGSGYLPIAISAPFVNVGGFTLRGNGFVMVTQSHVRVHDVLATCVDLDGTWHTAAGNGMFFVWAAPPVDVVDDVEFYRCRAENAHTHGFNMNQDYSDRRCRTISNVRFLDCRAAGCGYGVYGDPGVTDPAVTPANQSRSEWTTGFDLHEWQDLVNCEVVNCVAENNWESGFHLEPGARYNSAGAIIGPRTVSSNIVFKNCFSANNGQRNTYADHFFMSGYYLSRDTHLEDCVSFNNRNCGYYVHGGTNSSFAGCADDGSTYGWKVCKASEAIGIADCTSRNNGRWALWLSFARGLTVSGFRHSGVASDRGYQNILGWYKDEAAYQLPVTDSSFEITAVANGMPIINQAGSRNTYALSREGTPIGDRVVAGFAAGPGLGAAPLSVRFEDRSENATLWWWDFGDGTISHEQNPLHTYAVPGNYTVTLMAADALRYDTETRTGAVSVVGPVEPSFSAAPTVAPARSPIRFTSAATGNPYTYAWEFGDGATSTAQSPVHAYAAPGTYTVSLTAANPLFLGTHTAQITVYEPVRAAFAANRTAGPSPLPVAFTDTSSGNPTSWRWEFGDGATSTARNPVHAYAAPGTFTVTLTAGNGYSTDTTTVAGLVTAMAPPSVRELPGSGVLPADTDGDGRCEDLNGNGRIDFADVVLFFNQMTWIAGNEPVAVFDYNANGRIDFADVVWLFGHL